LIAPVSALKKTLRASEQDRPKVTRRRAQWKRLQGKVDARRLIFVDETWAKSNMTRLHGRCAKGQRLVAKAPHSHHKTLTFVAGLRCDGIVAPCVLRQPINGVSFSPGYDSSWCQRCGVVTSW
jgi:hypothetical protein